MLPDSAVEFARMKHAGQKRAGGVPYEEHLKG